MTMTTLTLKRTPRASAFTLVELIVVIIIITLLLSGLVAVGFRLRGRSQIQKTKATMAVLESAIEQYHAQFKKYPEHLVDCQNVAGANTAQIAFYNDPDTQLDAARCNTAFLRWQLARISALGQQLNTIPSEYVSDVDINASFNSVESANSAWVAHIKDWNDVEYKYFLDAFGKPLNYQDAGGLGGAPVLISAGPDEQFDTDDDIRSGRN